MPLAHRTLHTVRDTESLCHDIAFGSHRDHEVNFLIGCFRRYSRIPVQRVIDIACGTGPHLMRLARRGYRVTGLDISRKRLSYARHQSAVRGFDVDLTVQDMASLKLRQPVDAAISLQNAQGYLLTNADLLHHFHAVAQAVRPGGLYIFDRYIMSSWTEPVRSWSWIRRRRDAVVRVSFSVLNDVDPVTQVFTERLMLEAIVNGSPRVYRYSQRSRMVFPQELLALVKLAGGFDAAGWFSNFSLRRPLEHRRAPLMMIAVLRRV